MAFIEVSHLKYKYPHTKKLALDDLNFEVEKGDFLGIVGENGAGKSTLSQAFPGLVPQFYKGAYGGKVIVDNMETKEVPTAQLCSKVGLVFQNPFNQLSGAKDTVYGEIAFGLQNLAVPRQEMERRIEEALELLDISAFRDRNPFDLSGGQMQRVAIASILVMQPQLLILDEPTSQLDPRGADEVFQAVERLSATGITIIMIEQKMEKLALYCNKILLMHQGKQIAFGSPEEIFSRDDLESLGVKPPVYTQISRRLSMKMKDGNYPVTLQEVGEVWKLQRSTQPQNDQIKNDQIKSDQIKRDQTEYSTTFQIEHLDFAYQAGTPILQDYNVILDNRPTAIVGQNGAGKTTLVKLCKGLLKPTAGHLYFQQEDISSRTVASIAGKIGYVFQNPDDQIFKYHVLDEVMFGPMNIGMNRELARQKALEALEMVGLVDQADENPYDLELADRKMVAIASVLAMNTDVIILDEPTIAQDAKGRECLKRLIKDLSAQNKMVLAILHDMDFVAECFERVIVMSHGQILADGIPEEVFTDKNALQQACLTKPHVGQLCEQLGIESKTLTVEAFCNEILTK